MIDLVLATDMKQHFALLGQFQNAHQTAVCSVRAHLTAYDGHQKSETRSSQRSQEHGQNQKPASEQNHTLALQVSVCSVNSILRCETGLIA
jgi:hypothetical protein